MGARLWEAELPPVRSRSSRTSWAENPSLLLLRSRPLPLNSTWSHCTREPVSQRKENLPEGPVHYSCSQGSRGLHVARPPVGEVQGQPAAQGRARWGGRQAPQEARAVPPARDPALPGGSCTQQPDRTTCFSLPAARDSCVFTLDRHRDRGRSAGRPPDAAAGTMPPQTQTRRSLETRGFSKAAGPLWRWAGQNHSEATRAAGRLRTKEGKPESDTVGPSSLRGWGGGVARVSSLLLGSKWARVCPPGLSEGAVAGGSAALPGFPRTRLTRHLGHGWPDG